MSTGEELSTFAIARTRYSYFCLSFGAKLLCRAGTGVALSRFSLDSELVSFLLSNLVYASLVEAGSVADQLRGQLDGTCIFRGF